MSRVIKAAELKVLVTDDADTIIPAITVNKEEAPSAEGTILDASNLIGDAKRQAEEIVQEAEERASLLLQQAEEEIEALRLKTKEEGYAEGYREGLQDGAEKALQEAQGLLELLQRTVEEGAELRSRGLAALEEDCLKLSLLLADKIVRKSVEDDISWLKPIISEALQALGTVKEITVYLSPYDFSLLEEEEENLRLTARTKITFEQDASLSQGGCLIESENGRIDARLEKRLGKLGKSLMEVLYDEGI
nr:hypothetical protein [Bacillota bacterium]